MSGKKIKAMITNTFLEVTDILEIGQYSKKPVIDFASEGSEHGQDSIEEAMEIAEMKGLRAVLIEGEDLHKKMEEVLNFGEIGDAVTMHYPLPIGVSTVGKVVTLDKGKPIYIATTTNISDIDRINGIAKNAIYGIITAEADGVENPTVGIANIGGAYQTEKALLRLAENGYDISSTGFVRADGGIVTRGSDLLEGTPDTVAMDSLIGNLTTKVFSFYTTGGNYEPLGFGYGPDVGEGYDRLIVIVSHAPGTSVIVGITEYTVDLVYHNWKKIAGGESEKANKTGLKDIINKLKPAGKKDASATAEEVKMPPKGVVISQTPGIEVIGLEDAIKALWKTGIYAESDMGCTGPIVLMSDADKDEVHETLKVAGYVS